MYVIKISCFDRRAGMEGGKGNMESRENSTTRIYLFFSSVKCEDIE